MPKYKIQRDISVGLIPNGNGEPNIVFIKGDIVSGEVVTTYILNRYLTGIFAKPTAPNAYSESPTQFIPLDASNIIEIPSSAAPKKTIIIILSVFLLLVFGTFLAKKTFFIKTKKWNTN